MNRTGMAMRHAAGLIAGSNPDPNRRTPASCWFACGSAGTLYAAPALQFEFVLKPIPSRQSLAIFE